jgi:hypothetical protein
MRPSHALAAAFVVLLALVLWLVSSSEPPPVAGPDESKPHAAPAAVETAGNKRSLVEDAGEKAAPAERPAASASQPAAATGNLHVVVHNERGDALPACAVSAAEHEGRTDATGSVTFTVAADRTFVSVEPPAGSPLRGRSGWQTVRAGSTTELTIVLGPVGNMLFWSQLVAAENGRALPGVELFVLPANTLIRSDAEGFLHVVIADDNTWLDVRFGGRCHCRIVPEPGHETRATALRVPLTTGATLSVQVLDTAAAPVAGVGVELRLNPWQLQFPPGSRARGTEFVWQAGSDLGGRLSFADLPIGMTLHVTTRATDSFAALEEQRWALTSAQEERIITLAPASGVHGTVTDESGAAVAGVTVQANVPEGPSRPRALRPAKEEPRRTTTASDGSFRLGGLGAGLWWVGIPYGGKYQPTSVSVEVPAAGSVQVALRATAGLPVAGRAFAPDGSAAIGVFIEVAIDDTTVDFGPTDTEGRFRFANLPAGPCKLSMNSFAALHDLGLAEPVTIEAGDENVELRVLAVNGSISGRAIGSSDVWITAYRRDSHSVLGERCELDGSFFYRGLRAGTWDLTAMDRTGRAACMAAVQVLVGRETSGVLFDLQPAAKIAPRHGKADEFVVRNGEHVSCIDNLEPGAAGEARVPPGTWTVVFRLAGKELSRREVTVQAGEERTVDGDR